MRPLIRLPITCSLLLVLLAGCRATLSFDAPLRLQDGDWRQEGGSPSRTNYVVGEPSPSGRELWRASLAGALAGTALLAGDGVLFVPTKTGVVEAFDILSGERRAIMPFRLPLHGTPAVDGSRIVVPFAAGEPSLVCVDMAEGRVLWQRNAGIIEAGMLAVHGRAVAVTARGGIACIGIEDSSLLWETRLPGAILAAPAASDTALYVPCSNGDVVALALRDGRMLWRVPTGTPLLAAPAVAGMLLFAATRGGEVFAIDIRTGAIAWRRRIGAPVYAAPAVDEERVYLAGSDGVLHALRRGDGGEAWTATLPVLLATAPLVTDASVLLSLPDGRICAFDRRNGALRWSLALDSPPRSSPLLYRGILCVVTDDEDVIAFSGEERP